MTLRTAPFLILATFCFAGSSRAAEIAVLTPETWEEFAPQGKEADCIYGDYVLRNEHVVAVIAQPKAGRHANMTVKNVGGMLIDFTTRKNQNDQLSAYYFGASRFGFTSLDQLEIRVDDKLVADKTKVKQSGETVVLTCTSVAVAGQPQLTVRYELANHGPALLVNSTYSNPHDKAIEVELLDAIRTDRMFAYGSELDLFWAHDDWFRQAYGIGVGGYRIRRGAGNRGTLLELVKDEKSKVTLEPGAKHTVEAAMLAASSLIAVKNELLGEFGNTVLLHVVDPAGPVSNAKVTLIRNVQEVGSARTETDGKLTLKIPDSIEPLKDKYTARVSALGRPPQTLTIDPAKKAEYKIEMAPCGYVAAEITDKDGKPIPCKVAFYRKEVPEPDPKDKTPAPPTWVIPEDDPAKHPYFGPDAGDTAVHNVRYSHNGKFRQEIGPGTYEVVISYGPEYDAIFQEITVERGREVKLAAKLIRTVNTEGWVSADFHSHSSPSGDNVSSQLGRVQNLLCEHIEFAPCTEHNRIDSYTPHLKRLGVEHLLATCSGMELTGTPLPINHQNAFPLLFKPRTQDGGGPTTDINPETQIERLAFWDNKSDKLVQLNHPNLPQILGDRDLDSQPDAGFGKMFGHMDVIEVHPPDGIFTPPTKDKDGKLSRNPIYHWMQMLNLGYRIPGVVNTDAHYNFHESGWLRNYIASRTDDPAKIDTMDMVHAAERGNLVMSTGPFLEVQMLPADAERKKQVPVAGPGDDFLAEKGRAELYVRVQCANWLDVNRVQVFVNGIADSKLDFTRRATPERFGNGVVKFEAKLPLELKTDAHIIVATIGEGLKLGRVMGPKWGGQTTPVAVANPIFVDIDGDGFKPNGDLLAVPIPLEKEKLPIPGAK